ncbi:alpha/beta fold hydrolase [Streptomyces avicenniae]|uniref:alpha/beta fold hydrolase n=1 Tax=Streptomyces avicenniae TaxID=500153 RepID=UPI000699E65D|nr:alpha/beta hydrolase [Streptomyces avicenniae]
MTEFVLVSGAWLDARAWSDVVPLLRAAGHGAHALTLSGLGEKRGVPAGQRTHVDDITGAIEAADLREVVLVGHSYSGIPVGQAAERIGGRLARVVHVDANVPADGESFAGPDVLAAIEANDGFWPPLAPADLADQGLTDAQIARLVAESTPHPGASLTEPAVLRRPQADLPTTYVKCLLDWPEPSPDVAALLTGDRWELVEMDTGHWPMYSQPRALADVLLAAAAVPRG